MMDARSGECVYGSIKEKGKDEFRAMGIERD